MVTNVFYWLVSIEIYLVTEIENLILYTITWIKIVKKSVVFMRKSYTNQINLVLEEKL